MTVYLIECGLRGISRDYSTLWADLNRLGAVRATEASWLIETQESVQSLTEHILPQLDDKDQLLIVEIVRGAHWSVTRLIESAAIWLKERLP